MNCLFVDTARGEPEHFDNILIGDQVVKLLWIIPIFESEYAFISKKGLIAFDDLCLNQELSIIDLNRKPFTL